MGSNHFRYVYVSRGDSRVSMPNTGSRHFSYYKYVRCFHSEQLTEIIQNGCRNPSHALLPSNTDLDISVEVKHEEVLEVTREAGQRACNFVSEIIAEEQCAAVCKLEQNPADAMCLVQDSKNALAAIDKK
ncbi:unnamed protein product [Gongylonema pulchrum]|uniref:Uncharacterized protein n=1 Tax=Gongylonema pulchrum TaxID=637853 RepID=A0A183D7L8_9BILA|nr:unnamed protein product [Gongylonema pulchrum]